MSSVKKQNWKFTKLIVDKQKKKFVDNLNKQKVKLIIIASTVAVLLLSIIAAPFLEELFYLRPNLSNIRTQSMSVHFVDVGQGDAILVRFANGHTMLVDSGASHARNNLFNYINNVFFRGVRRRDRMFNYVVLTHADGDHAGNMLEILQTFKVNYFYRPHIYSEIAERNIIEEYPNLLTNSSTTYASIINKLNALSKAGSTEVIFTVAGLEIYIENYINVQFLTPSRAPNRFGYSNGNSISPIMTLAYSGRRVMLTGDAEAHTEAELFNLQPNDVRVDVLKIAHHGSRTSTTLEFLNLVQPRYGVISVGMFNNFGHPSREVLDNIFMHSIAYNSNLNESIFKTSHQGNIVAYINYGQDIAFLFIANINSYLFYSYYLFVLLIITIILAYVGYILLEAWFEFKNKNK